MPSATSREIAVAESLGRFVEGARLGQDIGAPLHGDERAEVRSELGMERAHLGEESEGVAIPAVALGEVGFD